MMGDMSVQSDGIPRGVTPEEVWAILRENALQQKETERLLREMSARTDRRIQETDKRMRETERLLKEMDAETDRQMRETDRKIGRLGSRLGDVIEHLMSPKLHEKFKEMNFVFSRSSRNVEIRDHDQKALAEVDVLLENGEYALAVEVKTHLTMGDVKYHIKRLGILRRVADERNDRRKYLGAVAGAVVDRKVSEFALKNGFYVIIPSGETVDIEAPEGFSPRIW
jgi:hypothetical protein